MTIRTWAVLALCVVLASAGLGYYSGCQKDKAKQQAVQAADKKHEVVVQQTAQGTEHDAKADAIAPELAALRAEVARLRRVSASALAVGAPTNELAPLVEAQDRVIQSQDAHDAEITAARDSWRAAATASQEEAKQLRVALDNAPKRYPWAAGVLYGTDKSKGIWVEYDLGRLRLGADLVSRPIDSTSPRTSIEAVARLGWRW